MSTDTVLFGLFLTVLCFGLAQMVQKRSKNVLANPIILSVTMIIIVLLLNLVGRLVAKVFAVPTQR